MNAEVTPQAPITTMGTNLYRKNVMKTLSVKPAKLGLALASRNTEQTNVHHAVHGVVSEVLEFQTSMRPFLLGDQLGKIDKFGADGPSIELGDVGYYLSVLGRVLKIKAVSDKKKIKLQGTLTARILDFSALAEQLLDLTKKTYYGPAMTMADKNVRNPATGEITVKSMPVVDKEAQAARWAERKAKIIEVTQKLMELHAELCLAILGTTTGPVNLANIRKLDHRFQGAGFEYELAKAKDPVVEAQVAQG